ncbi:hypothetical protein BPY_22400 [Bifidobacterium psychraerophilum]
MRASPRWKTDWSTQKQWKMKNKENIDTKKYEIASSEYDGEPFRKMGGKEQ